MPELPEVETTRRCLVPDLEGATIVRVDVRRSRMLRRQMRPADFADRLIDRRIDRLVRHGKFLIAELEGDMVWVTHLGMSGRVSMAAPVEPEVRHTNVIVGTDRDREFRLVDPRTFGFVVAYTPAELDASSLGALGPDAYTDLPPRRSVHGPPRSRRCSWISTFSPGSATSTQTRRCIELASRRPAKAAHSVSPRSSDCAERSN